MQFRNRESILSKNIKILGASLSYIFFKCGGSISSVYFTDLEYTITIFTQYALKITIACYHVTVKVRIPGPVKKCQKMPRLKKGKGKQ